MFDGEATAPLRDDCTTATEVQTVSPKVLIIACGALAHEIAELRRANGWSAFDVRCLPPELHNHPQRIPQAVEAQILEHRGRYCEIFVAYGDCGTGGLLDAVLQRHGIERLPGAHCYEAFATPRVFAELSEAEPGTFYLTDFLLRHYDRLVKRSLGLDRHPELATEYFRNYRRLIYLAQTEREAARERARAIADSLGLEFHYRFTGYGDLGRTLAVVHDRRGAHPWPL
jgi:hypothetical protein